MLRILRSATPQEWLEGAALSIIKLLELVAFFLPIKALLIFAGLPVPEFLPDSLKQIDSFVFAASLVVIGIALKVVTTLALAVLGPNKPEDDEAVEAEEQKGATGQKAKLSEIRKKAISATLFLSLLAAISAVWAPVALTTLGIALVMISRVVRNRKDDTKRFLRTKIYPALGLHLSLFAIVLEIVARGSSDPTVLLVSFIVLRRAVPLQFQISNLSSRYKARVLVGRD